MFYNVLCNQWTVSCRFDQCQYSVTAMTPRQQVLESIVGGGVVQVVHQSLDSRSVWLGAAQLLNGQAHVLVGAGSTADMARGAGHDKQTLATNHLLLGQGGGLALVIHLKSARYDRCQQEHVKTPDSSKNMPSILIFQVGQYSLCPCPHSIAVSPSPPKMYLQDGPGGNRYPTVTQLPPGTYPAKMLQKHGLHCT